MYQVPKRPEVERAERLIESCRTYWNEKDDAAVLAFLATLLVQMVEVMPTMTIREFAANVNLLNRFPIEDPTDV